MFVRIGLAVTAVGAAVSFRRQQQLHDKDAGNHSSSLCLTAFGLIVALFSFSLHCARAPICLLHKTHAITHENFEIVSERIETRFSRKILQKKLLSSAVAFRAGFEWRS